MSFKSIVRELREMKGIGNTSKRSSETKHWRSRARSHIAPENIVQSEPIIQGQWANLPPELLLDIIKRVEESEVAWPARTVVVFCAAVCKSWRDITKEIVKTPEESGRLTFPISLKQPGPRDSPLQCYIKRDRATSVYSLYFGLMPSEDERHKLLFAAKKIRRPASTEFVVSLVADDFSRASNTYIGKLRSNFLGTRFTISDSQPPKESSAVLPICHSSRRFNSKQVSPKLPAFNYAIATVSYELNILRTRGPRRMRCILSNIPLSSIQEGGTAPTPTDEKISVSSPTSPRMWDPLVLKNKAPRWHEQLQCWCLNFKGRVTVASVKNFQLVAAVDPSHNVSVLEQEKVILQFGKIGKDIFTMDYRYPLSAFQAFAICLSSFDTKPACE